MSEALTEGCPAGWQYLGQLTTGRSRPCLDGADLDLGAMWECPFFVPLPGGQDTHILCVSPYPHHLKDRPTNPVLLWLGAFTGQHFDVSAAQGELASCRMELRQGDAQLPLMWMSDKAARTARCLPGAQLNNPARPQA